ncbi:MAG TPA: TetR/AcrR family transcriptional regulator [Gemmatimonadaceae bacterium]|jgi:TetR/AcrR family transcriptional repressor of nem operon|nr:TetR/AcrR family transcriptional regulator [Gemmatimonadaceae bacterium]
MTDTLVPKAADTTRQKILRAAFMEFYRNGFQGGGLNDIVAAAGTTKGALFHHFTGKQDLGYAVVDEIIGPLLLQRWLDPLTGRLTERFTDAADPVAVLQRTFRTLVKHDMDTGHWLLGCPLNNMAQEMSPLDDGFRSRIDALYTTWRKGFAAAFATGIASGTVATTVNPRSVAALLVASQMGIWGTGKSSQSKTVMTQATDAICDYLNTLKA